MEHHEWIMYGMERGWIGPRVCAIHDGLPMTEEEESEFDEGYDPCIPVYRIYDSVEEKEAVEYNHSASEWRKL
jgi:hypothetical protein